MKESQELGPDDADQTDCLDYEDSEMKVHSGGSIRKLDTQKVIEDPDRSDLEQGRYYFIRTDKEWRDHSVPFKFMVVNHDITDDGVKIHLCDLYIFYSGTAKYTASLEEVEAVVPLPESPWE